MQPSDWIALAGVAVAGITAVAATVVGPLVAGRAARQQLLHAERIAVYANMLRLMRARTHEIELASLGGRDDGLGPSQEESEVITSRLLLLANADVRRHLETFFQLYWGTSLLRSSVEASRANDQDDIPSRLAIGDVLAKMRHAQDRAAGALRLHLGVKGDMARADSASKTSSR